MNTIFTVSNIERDTKEFELKIIALICQPSFIFEYKKEVNEINDTAEAIMKGHVVTDSFLDEQIVIGRRVTPYLSNRVKNKKPIANSNTIAYDYLDKLIILRKAILELIQNGSMEARSLQFMLRANVVLTFIPPIPVITFRALYYEYNSLYHKLTFVTKKKYEEVIVHQLQSRFSCSEEQARYYANMRWWLLEGVTLIDFCRGENRIQKWYNVPAGGINKLYDKIVDQTPTSAINLLKTIQLFNSLINDDTLNEKGKKLKKINPRSSIFWMV